ncbi:MAG: hypothetical protein QOE03_1233 [Micromonosporaceae bacterium]|nr:hypothetical protein [Micromonosporaceae bacterium]
MADDAGSSNVASVNWEPGSDGGGFWPTGDADLTWPGQDRAAPPPEPPEWSVRRRRGARQPELPAQGEQQPADRQAVDGSVAWATPTAVGTDSPATEARGNRSYAAADGAAAVTDPDPASSTEFRSPVDQPDRAPSWRLAPQTDPPPSWGLAPETDAPAPWRLASQAEPQPARPTSWFSESATDAAPSLAADQPGTGAATQAAEAAAVNPLQPPAWQALLQSGRRERVRPGIARPVTVTALAGVGWLAAVGYGVAALDPMWSVAALVIGVVGLAVAVRGHPLLGLIPVLAGAAAWGMATGGKVPPTFPDLPGDVRLVGWNVLYAVPLLLAYGGVTWVDAVRYARDRVAEAIGGRRWIGVADLPDAEPNLTTMEAVPSARFFQLSDGSCPHLVTAGRRLALIRATVWPGGSYTSTDVGEVLRNGRVYANGSDDLNGVVADVRTWSERLGTVPCVEFGFLIVHPASGRPGDRVDVDLPISRNVRVVPADRFVAILGEFLAEEPYRLDVDLTERLGEYLPIFEPAAANP